MTLLFRRLCFHRAATGSVVVALLLVILSLAGCAASGPGPGPNETRDLSTVRVSGTTTCNLSEGWGAGDGYIQGHITVKIEGTVTEASITIDFKDLKGNDSLDKVARPMHIDAMDIKGNKKKMGKLTIRETTKGVGTAIGRVPPTIDPRQIKTIIVSARNGRSWSTSQIRGSCPPTKIDVVEVG